MKTCKVGNNHFSLILSWHCSNCWKVLQYTPKVWSLVSYLNCMKFFSELQIVKEGVTIKFAYLMLHEVKLKKFVWRPYLAYFHKEA